MNRIKRIEIGSIEAGTIDDDFLHDRITLKVYVDYDFFPMKLYRQDGRLCSFRTQHDPYEYSEQEVSEEIKAAVNAKIGNDGGAFWMNWSGHYQKFE